MPQFDLNHFEVKVIPRLPSVSVTLKTEQRRLLDDVSDNENDGVTRAEMTLYGGQRLVIRVVGFDIVCRFNVVLGFS